MTRRALAGDTSRFSCHPWSSSCRGSCKGQISTNSEANARCCFLNVRPEHGCATTGARSRHTRTRGEKGQGIYAGGKLHKRVLLGQAALQRGWPFRFGKQENLRLATAFYEEDLLWLAGKSILIEK